MKIDEVQEILKTLKPGCKCEVKDIAEILNRTPQTIYERIAKDSHLKPNEIEKLEAKYDIKLVNYKASEFVSQIKKAVNKLKVSDVEKYDKKFDKWEQENYPDIISADLEDEQYSGAMSRTLEEAKDFIRVPYYPDLEASCGNGIIAPFSNPNPDFFPISIKYGLNKRCRYFVINAFGDSMEKTIYDKEYIIFENWEDKHNRIIDNKIYFFCYEGRLYIKRLIYNIDEVIVLSDNHARNDEGKLIYEPKSIKKDDMNELIIYGKFKGKIEND